MRVAGVVAMLGLAVGLAGCPGSGNSVNECNTDPECDRDEVCARDQMCAPARNVRAVITQWTIQGQAASSYECASHGSLYITFIGRDLSDTLGFAPVPCTIGQFMIDKLPDRFGQVELGFEGGFSEVKAIGTSNTVVIDLR